MRMIASVLSLALLAACATEQARQPVTYTVVKANDRIPFANYTVRNFRVGEDSPRSILLEAANGHWYRLTVDQICQSQLPWQEAIGIIQDGTGTLDKFTTLLVDGHRCQIRSVDQIADPDAKPAPAKPAA